MKIKSVRFQNCFSFGNEMTEVRFDRAQTSLVIGKNGAGKSSSVLDTLSYGLYGKPYRKVKLGQMINAVTGRDMLVEVDFESRGREWMVRRGQKPSVFEIYRDGQLINQADSNREMQEWFEKTVLMMDSRSFQQIVVLGSANHVPFMQLPAGQRREVIEDLLDIQVFSAMNEVLKERAVEIKAEMNERTTEHAVVERELDVELKHFEKAKRNVEDERAELKAELKGLKKTKVNSERSIETLENTASVLAREIADFEDNRKKQRELDQIEARLRDQLSRAEKRMTFLQDHADCPTCKQSIADEFREREAKEQEARKSEIEKGLEEIEKRIQALNKRGQEISDVQTKINAVDRELVRIRSDLLHVDRRIGEVQDKIKSLDSDSKADEARLKELEERVKELSVLRDEADSKARILGHAAALLKDQGIKARIIRQYVPLMNRLVNKYLAALELFVDFHLDENFNEEIRSRHRDSFSYESFSEGERLRIDLAILFAWREISRMRSSSSVDLIIFDEILDGSLDSDGIDYFLNIIRNMTDGTHIFIISHRDGVEDKFERVLNFVKRNNFSKLVETSV